MAMRSGFSQEPEGSATEVEMWDIPECNLGRLLVWLPPPLVVGRLELKDATTKGGLLCESYALHDAEDITALGGWRVYLVAQSRTW